MTAIDTTLLFFLYSESLYRSLFVIALPILSDILLNDGRVLKYVEKHPMFVLTPELTIEINYVYK